MVLISGGYRSEFRENRQYRCGMVTVPTGSQTGGFENLKLKNTIKIPKNSSRFIECNGVKSFQI
jgi:hypothetical protein